MDMSYVSFPSSLLLLAEYLQYRKMAMRMTGIASRLKRAQYQSSFDDDPADPRAAAKLALVNSVAHTSLASAAVTSCGHDSKHRGKLHGALGPGHDATVTMSPCWTCPTR